MGNVAFPPVREMTGFIGQKQLRDSLPGEDIALIRSMWGVHLLKVTNTAPGI